MDDDRKQGQPLGADTSPLAGSPDQTEAETSNRVNPDTNREALENTPLPPIPVLGSTTGTGAGSTADVMESREAGADTTRDTRPQGEDATDSSDA